jgi:hypothetical protein
VAHGFDAGLDLRAGGRAGGIGLVDGAACDGGDVGARAAGGADAARQGQNLALAQDIAAHSVR